MIWPRSSSVPMTTISACKVLSLRSRQLLLIEAENIHDAQMALAGGDGDGHLIVEHFPNQAAGHRRLIRDDVVFWHGVGLPQDGVHHLFASPQVETDHFRTNRDALAGDRQFFDKPWGA